MNEDLKASVQALLAASRTSDAHPTPDELVGYHARELAAADHERVRAHLIACADCARVVIDLASFPAAEPLDPRDRVTPADVSRSWRRFRERLPDAQRRPSRPSWLAFLAASPRLGWATAAVFLATSIALTGALMTPPPDGDAARPRVNFEIAELSPDDDLVRAAGGRTVRVPATAAGVVLALALAETRTFEEYELQIRTQDATPDAPSLWTTSELRPSELGLFTVEIPRGFLPAGRYRIVVDGREEDQRVTLGTYGVELLYE